MSDADERGNSGVLPPGFVVADRYEIERCLGSGGMGNVYLARDLVLGEERVAVKILHSDLVANQRQTQRFLREVQLMRRVNHKNVVRTFDVGSEGNLVYFTMEFVSGTPLEQFIEEQSFPRDTIDKLIIQICEGLEAIHRASIIHRDLKPANILVMKDGSVKITDFGVARPEYSELTAHNEILGSALYIAPEIWLGTKMTHSVDLYSLGVMLYELMTGTLPFDGDSPAALMRMHLEYQPPPPKELNNEIPPWLNKLILKLLAKSAVDRPKEAREVVEYVKLHTDSSSRIVASARTAEAKAIDALYMSQFEQLPAKNTAAPSTAKRGAESFPAEAPTPVRSPAAVTSEAPVQWGPELLARLLCVVLTVIFTLGLGGLLQGAAMSLSQGIYLGNSAVLRAADFPPPWKVGLFLVLITMGYLIKLSGMLALIGAMAGSMKLAVRFFLSALFVQTLFIAVLFLWRLRPAYRHGVELINAFSFLHAAAASARNLVEAMLLDPVVSAFGSAVLGQGLMLLPESKEIVWANALPLLLLLVNVLLVGLFVRRSLRGGKINPNIGLLFTIGGLLLLLGLSAVIVPAERLTADTELSGGAGRFFFSVNFPETVLVSWLFIYFITAALSIISGVRKR